MCPSWLSRGMGLQEQCPPCFLSGGSPLTPCFSLSPMLWFLTQSFNNSLLFSCCVLLFVTPWIAAHQAPLSSTASRSLLRFMSIESVMPSYHLILCHPFYCCPQSFSASGSLPVSRLLASGGQIIGASALLSVLLMNIQSWFPLGLTNLISLLRDSQESSPAPQFWHLPITHGRDPHFTCFLQVHFLVNPYFFLLLCPYLCCTDIWLRVSRSRTLHTFAREPFNENVTALGPTCSGVSAKCMKLHWTDAAAFKANSEDVEFPSPLVQGEFCLHEEGQVPALVLKSFSQGSRKREPS